MLAFCQYPFDWLADTTKAAFCFSMEFMSCLHPFVWTLLGGWAVAMTKAGGGPLSLIRLIVSTAAELSKLWAWLLSSAKLVPDSIAVVNSGLKA
ncbi:hypothetical protein Mapa_004384 [Marchantia paleacea]|nr:hypothetical protein Mapa_004384 [Marchantia paleacea]